MANSPLFTGILSAISKRTNPAKARRTLAEDIMIRNILFAGMIVLATTLMIACSGGDTTPAAPAPHQPTVEYRLYVLDLPDGGQIITNLSARQGVNTPFEVRYDSREGTVNWYPVAQESTLDVTIEGAPSGHKVPDIGLSGGQYRLRSGTCRLEFFPPCGGQTGSTFIVLRVRESGASVRVSVTIFPQSSGNQPPTCRDLHPEREAIGGYWWDCVDNTWVNTGEPVNPPPPPPDKNLYALVGELYGFYSGEGQQSLTLKLKPIPDGVGFINWEIVSGPSGAMTVPLGSHPQHQCEFYYCAAGEYHIRAVPFESELAFDAGKTAVGQPAEFAVMISSE